MTRTNELVGRRVGPYEVDAVIGHGGMSTLYRATDVRLGRPVALKVMSDALGDDAEFRERFVTEAQLTSALDHPNVVPLYDFGDADGRLFLALRYVEGQDLSAMLARGPLDPMRALAVLGQVARALDALHTRDLVHLDVKPANVLVTQPAGTGADHAYLADFGLTGTCAAAARTRGGDFLGSPDYAAPEHLRGRPVDARTDVYSLTCVLYACLTGGAPHTGTIDDVVTAHLGGVAPTGLGEAMGAVVRRGMSVAPADRYAGCAELIAAARQAALTGSDGPVVAPRPVQPRPSAPRSGVPRPGMARPGLNRPVDTGSPVPPTPGIEPDVAAMRLRAPLPANTSSVLTSGPALRRWVVPAAVLVGLVILVLILVLAL